MTDPHDPELTAAFAALAPAVEARAAELDPALADTVWTRLTADPTKTPSEASGPVAIRAHGLRVLAGTCTYCHGEFADDAERVLCEACLAAHHEGCFAQHDACSAPGCGSRRFLRSAALRQASPRPGRRWLAAAAGVLFAVGLSGVIASSWHRAPVGRASAVATRRLADRLEAHDWEGAERLLDQAAPSARGEVGIPGGPEAQRLADLRTVVHALGRRDPLRTRWGRLVELCQRLHFQDPELQRSVEGTTRHVALAGRAYDTLVEAQAALAEAQAALPKDTERASERLGAARAAASRVPDLLAFATPRAQLEARLLEAGWLLAASRVEVALGHPTPDWDTVRELTLAAQVEAGADPERAQRIRNWLAQCDREQAAETSYMAAVDIINAQQVSRYDEALKLFGSVGADTRLHADAQAYMDWVDSDLKVRAAKKLYDQGDEHQAFALLNDALRHESLGPEARASVRSRRQAWANVARHYQLGTELFHNGQLLEAIPQFEAVLESEPNPVNRFHAMARLKLEHIQIGTNSTLEHELDQGMRNLTDGNYERAIHMFELVKQHPRVEREHLEQIQAAVEESLRRERLLRVIERDMFNNRTEKYLDHYYALKLLKLWLPEDHEHMPKIDRDYSQVRDWCQSVLRNHPDFQPPPRRRR